MKTKQCEYDDREKIRGKDMKMSNPDDESHQMKWKTKGFSVNLLEKKGKNSISRRKISYSYIIQKPLSKVKL